MLWYPGRGGGRASQDFVILAGSGSARGRPAANAPGRGLAAGRGALCHLLGGKKGKRDSFLVGRFPGNVSQVHIYCLLPVKLCFYASQSHHFDVVCLA